MKSKLSWRSEATPGISMWFSGPTVIDYGLAGPMIDANAVPSKVNYRDPVVPSVNVIGPLFHRAMEQVLEGSGWKLVDVIGRGRAEIELVLADREDTIWRVPAQTSPWTPTALLQHSLLKEAAERVREKVYAFDR